MNPVAVSNWLLAIVAVASTAFISVDLAKHTRSSPHRGSLFGLFVGSLALRLWVPPAPHDINDRMQYFAGLGTAELVSGIDTAYGAGHAVWCYLMGAALGGAPVGNGLFHLHAVVGALAPVMLTLWALSWIGNRTVAWTAGVLLAVSAPHVRLSHTDAQVIVEITVALWCLWSTERLVSRGNGDPQTSPWTLQALMTAAALGWALNTRPEAPLIGPAMVLLFASKHHFSWNAWRVTAVVWVGGAVLGMIQVPKTLAYLDAVAALDEMVLADQLRLFGVRHFIFADPAWVGWLMAPAMVIGSLERSIPWPQRVALFVVAVGFNSMLGSWSTAGDSGLVVVRHMLRVMPIAALLAATGLLLVTHERARLVAAIILVASTLPRLTQMGSGYIIDLEWAAQLEAAGHLQPSDRLYRFEFDGDAGLVDRFQHATLGFEGDIVTFTEHEPLPKIKEQA